MKVLKVIHFFWIAFALTIFVSAQSAVDRTLTSRDMVGDVSAGPVNISPNGKWVFYWVSTPLIDVNRVSLEYWLAETSGATAPRKLPTEFSSGHASWSPDSRSIAFATSKGDEIRMIYVEDVRELAVARRTDMADSFGGLDLGTISNPKWSPDGRWIAFTIGSKQKRSPAINSESSQKLASDSWSAKEMLAVEPEVPLGERTVRLLCVLNAQSGKASRLTGRELNVASRQPFSWSPDSNRIVFSAETSEDYRSWNANSFPLNLYTIDRNGGSASTLYQSKGFESSRPNWSPDGKWIAFCHSPIGGHHPARHVAVISATGGESRFLTDNEKVLIEPAGQSWSSDSRNVYFEMYHEMRNHLFRVPVAGGNVEKVTPDDNGSIRYIDLSADGKTFVYVYSSTTTPDDVYVSSPSFKDKRKLTDLNPQLKEVLKEASKVKVETLKWKSADNKWDIHGILVKPTDYQEGRKYPLVVVIRGGPSMINLGTFGLDPMMPALQLASRGYVVLYPNTRGRQGYGVEFSDALVTEGYYTFNAVGDVTSGAQELVRRGIVDPNRMAVGGHSYGGNLTSMIITKTNMFKAAWIGDNPTVDRLAFAFVYGGGGDLEKAERVGRAWYGGSIPRTGEDVKRFFDDSPVYAVQNVKTPTLMHCGERSPSMKKSTEGGCWVYFNALGSYKIPLELWVWPDAGHVGKPAQMVETFDKQIEWFDYWVRGIATKRMAARYGQPRNGENTATASKSMQK